MNRPVLALTVAVLLNGLPLCAQPAPTADPTAIRDIRGPLPPAGLPTFAGTFLVLLVAGLGLAVTARVRKRKNGVIVSSSMRSPAIADLAALRAAYERQELPAVLLFQQLAAIARSRLVPGDSQARTSAEVLEAAAATAPAEIIAVAAALLDTCDRVRFGDWSPDAASVAEAFSALQQLPQHQPGSAP